MKFKWFLAFVFTVLVAVGVSLDSTAVRNQEIVVEFGGADISQEANQRAITTVTASLHRIGVQNITVHTAVDGTVTISYHSTLDVLKVKRMLTSETDTALTLGAVAGESPVKFPFEKSAANYKLDVYEIQKSSDTDRGFDGILVQFETKVHRFSTPDIPFLNAEISEIKKNRSAAIAFVITRRNNIAFECNAHNIPEVRAGPLS